MKYFLVFKLFNSDNAREDQMEKFKENTFIDFYLFEGNESRSQYLIFYIFSPRRLSFLTFAHFKFYWFDREFLNRSYKNE
jgi:hypothetical protein